MKQIISALLEQSYEKNNFRVTAKADPDTQSYIITYEYMNNLLFQLEFIEAHIEVPYEKVMIQFPEKKIYLNKTTVYQPDCSHVMLPEDLPFRDAFLSLEQQDLTYLSQHERNLMIYNYFCGTKIDDVRHRDSVTISSFGAEDIKEEITQICEEVNKSAYFVPLITWYNHPKKGKQIEETIWYRDIFRRKGNGTILLNGGLSEKFLEMVDEAITLNPRSGKYAITKKALEEGEEGSAQVFGFEEDGSYGSQLLANMDEQKAEIKALFEKAKIDIEVSKVLLEGGNTYSLTNKKGELFIVIGENSLPLTAAYRKQHELQDLTLIKKLKEFHVPKNEFYQNMYQEKSKLQWYDMEEAKIAIADECNIHPSQLLVLPNPLFHLDMIMTQGPDGKILVHDFDLVDNTLLPIWNDVHKQRKRNPDNHKLALKEAYLDSILYQNKKLKDILEEFIFLLKKEFILKDFEIVSIPAVAYQFLTAEIFEEEEEEEDEPSIILNLVNGITGKSKSGNFLIALSPGNKHVKPLLDVTKSILEKHGIKLYTVGTAEQASSILRGVGSLRCMSFPNGLLGGDMNELIKLLPPYGEETGRRFRREQFGSRRLSYFGTNLNNMNSLDEISKKDQLEELKKRKLDKENVMEYSGEQSVESESFTKSESVDLLKKLKFFTRMEPETQSMEPAANSKNSN